MAVLTTKEPRHRNSWAANPEQKRMLVPVYRICQSQRSGGLITVTCLVTCSSLDIKTVMLQCLDIFAEAPVVSLCTDFSYNTSRVSWSMGGKGAKVRERRFLRGKMCFS